MAPACHLSAAAVVVALLLLAGGRGAEAGADTSDCRVAQIAFGECTDYITSFEDGPVLVFPQPRCCKGLRTISDLATTSTREQRRELCECVRSVMVAAGNLNPRHVEMLRYGAGCAFRADFLPSPSSNYSCSRYVFVSTTYSRYISTPSVFKYF
uniref:Bifunctional inhibitor/plant lipid transfer protein/seed storage helical domain-containing protein n=1 Tax=Triticum aestivum TaxID=4565 RepID=A0A3B6TKW8_WHEAT